MKYMMPYHLGSGNRGCEGIARGISKLFNIPSDSLFLLDMTINEYEKDKELGLEDVGTLFYIKNDFIRVICKVLNKIGIRDFLDKYDIQSILKRMNENDIILITGGDIYCYKDGYKFPNKLIAEAKKKGIKSVLFGATVDLRYLPDSAIDDLNNYSLIISRDSITNESLRKRGLNNYLFPDPAFSLEPVPWDVPAYFKKKTVGINISCFTTTSSIFDDNLNALFKYLISKDYEICLIPHVLWKDQDDRESINKIDHSDKHFHILDTEKLSYLQIRYAISKCDFFIGGRTHSVISAYCTRIPCLSLGYSQKSVGIAKDIGLPEFTVIDSKHLENDHVLLDRFVMLEKYDKNDLYLNLENYIKKLDDLQEVNI